MNVLSLFDGMSCGMLALERAGIPVNKYYASEIDKFATRVSEKNYPNIIRLGDITEWRTWGLDWSSIDLVIGGSPCQGLSSSGKGEGLEDPRSKLFFVFVEILNHIQSYNPDVRFLLENVVPREKGWLKIISDKMECNPVMINSALVSAQSRKRLYWCNWPVTQPEDKGILLKDIIVEGFSTEEMTTNGKSFCLTARYSGATPARSMEKREKSMIAIEQLGRGFNKGGIHTEKSPTLTSSRWENNHRLVQIGMTDQKGHDVDRRVYSIEDKCPTLTAQSGGNKEKKIGVIWTADRDKAHCIDANYHKGGNPEQYFNKSRRQLLFANEGVVWRKLYPVECERLQTVPDNYTDCVSNTQRYKMLGNGWTIDVIAHIFKGMSNA